MNMHAYRIKQYNYVMLQRLKTYEIIKYINFISDIANQASIIKNVM